MGDQVIMDGGLELNGDLTVRDLYSRNITNSDMITTKDLTVTGNAHFFNLVIDEVKHAGGQVVLSAGALRIDYIGQEGEFTPSINFGVAGEGLTDEKYKTLSLYQICKDDDQSTDNTVQKFDHVICYTANVNDEGEFDARSWWTLVTGTGHGEKMAINGEVVECNRIDIVTKVLVNGEWVDPSWGEVVVKENDNCAVLGSHNRDRRSAIMLSAYNTFDPNIKAPAIVQYANIDGFTLAGKAWTCFARNGNKIKGDLIVESTGDSIEDFLRRYGDLWLHRAWANSPDGKIDFVRDSDKDPDKEYDYMGVCTTRSADDSELTYDKYHWTAVASRADRLIATRERLFLASDDCLYLDVEYMTKYISFPDFQIYADIFTYRGATTQRRVAQVSSVNETIFYTGLIQPNWSGVGSYQDRYCSATVYLTDSAGKIYDTHTVPVTWDAGAVFSVTDTIKARVADNNGNINSLIITANSLIERISSAESVLELIITDKSLSIAIDDLENRMNNIEITVDGLRAKISKASYDDGWIVSKFNELEITVDGIQSHIERIEHNAYDDTEIRRQISELSITVAGFDYKVGDKIVGCINILNATDFGIDEQTDFQSHWTSSGTVTASDDDGPVEGHGYLQIQSGASITQTVTGEIMPAEWYTLSIYCNQPTFTTVFSTSIVDTDVKYWFCMEELDFPYGNLNINWAAPTQNSHPALNSFRRYWVTFKTSASMSMTSPLTLTITSTSNGTFIALPKLEQGQYCSPWDYSQTDREARFHVDPSHIYLQLIERIDFDLKKTGIDIEHGKITLTADTTDVIGNLNIRQANDSGVTVYDETDKAVINIQPREIGQFSDFSGQNYYNYFSQLEQSVQQGYQFTCQKLAIGQLGSGNSISVQNIRLTMLAYSGSDYASPSTVTGTCYITKSSTSDGTQTQVSQTSLTLTSSGTYDWTSGQTISYTTDAQAYYFVYFYMEGSGTLVTGQTTFCQCGARIYTQAARQTMIAKDGMFVNTSANKILWIGDDAVVMRQGDMLMKFDSSRGLQWGRTYGSGQSVTLQWFDFWNYRPMMTTGSSWSGGATYMNVPTINEYRYCFSIDASTARGDLYVDMPALNNNEAQETWVLLPSTSTIPVGWQIRIIWCMGKTLRANLYVSTYESSYTYDDGVIMDSNRNMNWYIKMTDGSQDSDTFVWTGIFWKALHDSQ